MLKTRILLIAISAVLIWLIFLLPKVVVDNDNELEAGRGQSASAASPTRDAHAVPENLAASIRKLRVQYSEGSSNEKNAIFADSLANLYQSVGKFDSAGWFAEEASKVFNSVESWTKAGDQYYQAYTLALDQG